MSKAAEISYVQNLARICGASPAEVERNLRLKPFTCERRGYHLMDIGQILKLMPPPPCRLLDLGCGSGWTSRMFALSGYDVTGSDICPDMIEIAKRDGDLPCLRFIVHDWDSPMSCGPFDVAIIYDALHHATDVLAALRCAHASLRPGGLLITAEPGAGHETNAAQVSAQFGTTEKDMPFAVQQEYMLRAGFRDIQQYLRFSELPMTAVNTHDGYAEQFISFSHFSRNTVLGFTSLVTARR